MRWKMKDPGRADQTTEYSSVPLMSSFDDDADDQVRCDSFRFVNYGFQCLRGSNRPPGRCKLYFACPDCCVFVCARSCFVLFLFLCTENLRTVISVG